MKKIFSLLLFIFCSLFLCAEKFEYNHLYYNTLSDCTAEVSSQASLNYNHDSLVIRQTVDYRTNAYRIVRIGEAAFYEYPSLVFISLPNSVTSIGMGAFYNCTNLSKILLPPALQTIGCGAFANCTSLKEVTSLATVPPTREEMLPNAPTDEIFYGVDVANIPLYVPAESIELYKNADQWKDFGQILPIDDFNKSLVGEWKCIGKEDITVSISDSIICNNIFNQSNRYTASASQLYLERLWTFDDAPHRWEACDYSLKGDTLWIDKFWMGTMWVNIYPPILYDIVLVRVKDTIDPKELFPTLWGLQQTICSGYYGEEGDEWASGLTGPSQEITMMDGKPYLQWGSWYLREENDKILVYSEIQKKDLVLYDFTLELGDTLTTLNLVTPEFLEYEGIVGIVDYPLSDYDYTYPIDTLVVTELSKETLLDGKEYTRWKFSDGTVYVEGIGSMSETFFHHIADHLPVPVSYLGSYLVCVSKNNKLLYQMDDTEMERLGAECLCDGYQSSYKDQWCNQWNILSHGQESDPDEPFPHARTSIYWLSENTVNRNGYEYIPLMYSSSKPNVESTQLVGELRFTEEDKQVYFYYDNTEYLLYDFGAQVGDQLQIFSGINNYNYYDYYETYTHVVTRREYLDDGRIKLTSIPFFGDPVPDDINENNYLSVTWIEGVGSEHGIVHNNINNLPGMGTEWLLCAYRDDECRYTTDDPEYAPLGCVYNEGDVINAVEHISVSAPSVQKIIKDGQLLILRDSKTYNVMGVEITK